MNKGQERKFNIVQLLTNYFHKLRRMILKFMLTTNTTELIDLTQLQVKCKKIHHLDFRISYPTIRKSIKPTIIQGFHSVEKNSISLVEEDSLKLDSHPIYFLL